MQVSLGWWSRRHLVVVLLVVSALLAGGVPGEAVEVRPGDSQRLLGQTSIERLDIRLEGGQRARGDVIRFRTDDPAVRLEPRLAQGVAVGLETVPTMARRETPRGAFAGVNGGYFLASRLGVPNGLFVDGGRLVTGDSLSQTGIPAGRAVVGIRDDGTLVGDRLHVGFTLGVPGTGQDLPIDDLNRPLQTEDPARGPTSPWGEVLLYDRSYGTAVTVPAGSTVLVLEDQGLPSAGRMTTVVRERFVPSVDRSFAPDDGSMLLVAHGTRASELTGLTAGAVLDVTSELRPFSTDPARWQGLRGALPGGGLLVLDGQVSSGTVMASEGLNHASLRRARTAVGWTDAGQVFLVTVDETAGSSGLTLFELALVLRELGADDAVALDGGGSTTMVVDGHARNQPSAPSRAHSSGLFLYADPPPPTRNLTSACPDGLVPGDRFTDTTQTVHAAAIDCLAWWRVTTGVTADRFVPAAGVTRAQMASFLARWLVDLAERGGAVALPPPELPSFGDVHPDDVHAPAIARLTTAGIIQGRTATTFDPVAPVTRAETATLLKRALEHATATALPGARDTFVDDNLSFHEASIDQLAAAGIIGGTGGFSFVPDDPVSRGAMASLMMRASANLVDDGMVSPAG
ncbi:MAG: phosphodiester glycosidase family protein [Nitriliruptoraceae bacterium]